MIAGLVDLFVWLLLLKSFFLPLFIIPTGSMAATLNGAHAVHTCPNCGTQYTVGFHTPTGPDVVQCPNCRWQELTARVRPDGVRLIKQAGDRIVVHGWKFDLGGRFGPKRWDVVVFKNPNQPYENYIKRLIGLPNETIEVIDGDIWVRSSGDEAMHVARKTPQAQRSLWFVYYDHDHLPAEPARNHAQRGPWVEYYPHFVELRPDSGWTDLATRTPRFDGLRKPAASIQFVTERSNTIRPGQIWDVYAYNAIYREFENPRPNVVSDVRLSATVAIEQGDGYVELSITKYSDRFAARLHRDGRLIVLHEPSDGPTQIWLDRRLPGLAGPVELSIGHADYQLVVTADGREVFRSTPQQYGIDAAEARRRARLRVSPTIRITAADVRAHLAHVRIDRDVHYTVSDGRMALRGGQGVLGRPVRTGPEAYFCMGDNSPSSLDGRWWTADQVGPHLRRRLDQGRYVVGTVPADQMIGQAFFVYWPGFLPLRVPLLPREPTVLPNFGRVRWIH